MAALHDRPDVPATLAATSELTGERTTLDALSAAVGAGLIAVDEGGIRFRHPLMRSAVEQSAAPESRRAAHGALAAVLAGTPERSIWHRVAAADGPDEALAAELETLARRAHRQGSIVTAVGTLARAAAMTPDAPIRGRRLLDAAELALEIGRTDLVQRLLASADALDLAEREVHRRDGVHDIADHNPLDADHIDALLERAENLTAGGDTARATQALLTVAFHLWWARPSRRTAERVVAARERAGMSEPVTGLLVPALVDPIDRGSLVVERLARLDLDATRPEELRLAAVAGAIVGDFERTAEIAATAVAGPAREGSLRAGGAVARLRGLGTRVPRRLEQRARDGGAGAAGVARDRPAAVGTVGIRRRGGAQRPARRPRRSARERGGRRAAAAPARRRRDARARPLRARRRTHATTRLHAPSSI